MSFGYLSFSSNGEYLIAFTQYDINVQMMTLNASTGALINNKALRSVFPYSNHRSILVSSDPVNPMVYMASEFFNNENLAYKYEIIKFALLNESATVDSLFYFRSMNGSNEN